MRPDDAAALQQIHQPACLRKIHLQLALGHRGGAELGAADDEYGGGIVAQDQAVASLQDDAAKASVDKPHAGEVQAGARRPQYLSQFANGYRW